MGQKQNTSALQSFLSQDIIFTFQKHEWSKSTAWKLKPSSMHLCFSQIKLEKHCGLHDSCSVGTAFSQSIMLAVYISHLHLSVFPVFISEVEGRARGSLQRVIIRVSEELTGQYIFIALRHLVVIRLPSWRVLCNHTGNCEAVFGVC